MAALSGDAARQPESIKTAFATGLESLLGTLGKPSDTAQDRDRVAALRAKRIDVIAQVIGAIVLSRACPDDSPLADEILDVCRKAALSRLTPRVKA